MLGSNGWLMCKDEFLTGFGFKKSIVDRRCFNPHRGGETIFICIHVVDSFIWCSDNELLAELYAAWS